MAAYACNGERLSMPETTTTVPVPLRFLSEHKTVQEPETDKPQEESLARVSNRPVSCQLSVPCVSQLIQVRVLSHLHGRKLGPGESVWISTLARQLDLDKSRLMNIITEELGLGKQISAAKSNEPTFVVPPLDTLSQLLIDRNVDSRLLEPKLAVFNGRFRTFKWLERPDVCENGWVRFSATWKGKLPPSSICCHDLNFSGRAYAESQFHISLPADGEPRALRVVVELLSSHSTTRYRVHFSDESISDLLNYEELDGVARLLVAQNSIASDSSFASDSMAQPTGRRRRGRLNNYKRNRNINNERRRTRAGVSSIAKSVPPLLSEFGSAARAYTLCHSVDADWVQQSLDDKKNVDEFPAVPSSERIQQSISTWRQLMSSPHVDMAGCAVCAERTHKVDVSTFSLSAKNRGAFKLIGPAVLQFMQQQLIHDPRLPLDLDDLPEDMSCLHGLALDDTGLDRIGCTISICNACLPQLQRRRMPAFALANGLQFGRVPAELRNLTWAEQRLVCVYNTHLHLVHFRNEEIPGAQQPKHGQPQSHFKGNAFCVPQDCLSVNQFLPPSPKQLSEHFQVIFLGANQPVPDDVKTTFSLKVSRDRVSKALQWLFQNNRFYRTLHEQGELFISEENLSFYAPGDGAVPDSVVENAILRIVATSDLAHDTSSYTRPDNATPTSSALPDGTHEAWTHTGVVDTDALGLEPAALQNFLDQRDDIQSASGTTWQHQKPEPAVVRNTTQSNRVLIVPAGSPVFMLDKSNPDVDHGAYPTLYPYGVGGPTYQRKIRLGAARYTKHLMWLADRRFSMHPPFAFTMFNWIQRQRVCWGAGRSLRAGYFVDFASEMHKLSADAIAKVIQDLRAAQLRGQNVNLRSCSAESKDTGRMLSNLFHQMTTLGGTNLPRTHSSKKMSRAELFAMYIKFGLPDLFITINPEDRHAPLVVYFHDGSELRLSLHDPDWPSDMPTAYERFRIVTNDPLAAAQFSAHVMNCFISALLGFGRKKSDTKIGILGDVRAYHFNDEEQLRGSLHYHGLVWLDHKPSYDVFADLLEKDDAFKARVLAYLSAIIKNEPPSLFDSGNRCSLSSSSQPRDVAFPAAPCFLAECQGATHALASSSTATAESRAADEHISLKRVGDPRTPSFSAELAHDLNLLVAHCMLHTHTQCCVKDKRNQGLPAEKRECRFKAPWPLCDTPHIDATGKVHLRRQHHWTNSYNESLLACLRANHDLKTLWAAGTRHMAMIFYVTNYVTKLNHKLLNSLLLIEMAVAKFEHWKDPTKSSELQAKSLLIKIYNHLQRDVELSLQTVVHTLAGFKERYVSHKCVSLCTPPFLSLIEQDDSSRSHVEVSALALDSRSEAFKTVRESPGAVLAVNLRMDYQLRPEGLDNCCLYDFVCCWQKAKRCARANAEMTTEERAENGIDLDNCDSVLSGLFQFKESHPQRENWGLRFRSDHADYVPVLRGPIIPSRNKDAPRFARQMLLLFKPWRNVSELRVDDQRWTQAFAEFEEAASARIRNYITNLETMDVHRSAWQDDLENKDAERMAERNDLYTADTLQPWWDDKENSAETCDGDEDSDGFQLNLLPFDSHDHDAKQLSLYNAALRTSFFSANSRQCVLLDHSDLASNEFLSKASTWFEHATGDSQIHALASSKQRLQQLTDRLEVGSLSAAINRSAQPAVAVEVEDVTPDAIARKFKLNKKQHIAFSIIADRFLKEVAADSHKADQPPQLRMFLGGAGGTGKSLVIKAVQDLFKLNGHAQWLATCGPTGTSAFNVRGSTLFTLLGISWAKKSKADSIADSVDRKYSTRSKVGQKLAPVRFLIIDEISMVGASTFASIDESLKSAKGGSADSAWAGVHIICVGDYAQLKPIRKASLFSASTSNPGKYKRRSQKESSLTGRTGRELFTEFNDVIFLDEQMRQREDPTYGALLDRLRLGKSTCCCQHGLDASKRGAVRACLRNEAPSVCKWQRETSDEYETPQIVDQCDYHTLSSRCLSESSAEAHDPKWKQARLVTHSNPVSAAWNRDCAADFASQTNQPILVSVAHDKAPRGHSQLSKKLQRRLLRLPDSSTASRLGALPLVAGMRVLLRDNLATELGLVNGAEGSVVKVGLHPDENLPMGLFSVQPGQLPPSYHLRMMPQYVIVKFDHLKLSQPLPGTSAVDEVMITPDVVSFEFSGFGPTRTVKRQQFPLTPCQSMTVPMVQGRTIQTMICDLNIDDAPGHKLTCLYVMLSRGQAANRVRLLRPFHHKHLHRYRDPDIARDEQRLRQLENETLRQFAIDHPVSNYDPPPPPAPTDCETLVKTTRLKCRHGRACSQCVAIIPSALKQTSAHAPEDLLVAVLPAPQTFADQLGKRKQSTDVPFLQNQPPNKRLRTSDEPVETMSKSPQPWCAARFRLSERDSDDMTKTRMLDDNAIHAFQCLIKEAFPTINGWLPPAVAVHPDQMCGPRAPYAVQIHNNMQTHWLVSLQTTSGILVADSLLCSPNPSIVRQLISMYGTEKRPFLDVTYLPCQRQLGSFQCGDFAIFNAAIFAQHARESLAVLANMLATTHFDQSKMRRHLLDCLKADSFLPPSTMAATPIVSLQKPTTYRINCVSGKTSKLRQA